MPELRRQPRVVYHGSVRLHARGHEHSVVARVQNLSASGIYITGKEIPETGTEVVCRMLVGGERCTLRGQVAWMRPPEVAEGTKNGGQAPAGAGIRFLDLSDRQAELLNQVIEPADSDRPMVDVWFEGLRSPIRSHAVIADEGLRVTTRLPFLRLGSPVKVSFVRRGVEEQREGKLEAVTLEPSAEDGVPRLQLIVATPLAASARGTIEIEETTVVSAPPKPEPASPSIETELTQKTMNPLLTELPPLLPVPPFLPEARKIATPVMRLGVAWLGVATLAVAAYSLWSGSAPVVAPAPAVVTSTPARPKPKIVQLESLPTPVGTSASSGPRIETRVTTNGGSLFVPLAGSTRGMVQYRLAEPNGIAISLPHGRARVASGVHATKAPFTKVVVRRHGQSGRLGVYFPPGQSARVTVEAGGLRVTVAPEVASTRARRGPSRGAGKARARR